MNKRLISAVQSRLFFLIDNKFMMHLQLYNFPDCLHSQQLHYTRHERSFSKIHNRGTLIYTFKLSSRENINAISFVAHKACSNKMSSMLNVFVESSDQIKSGKTKKSHVFVHFLTENLIISNAKPLQTQLYI